MSEAWPDKGTRTRNQARVPIKNTAGALYQRSGIRSYRRIEHGLFSRFYQRKCSFNKMYYLYLSMVMVTRGCDAYFTDVPGFQWEGAELVIEMTLNEIG